LYFISQIVLKCNAKCKSVLYSHTNFYGGFLRMKKIFALFLVLVFAIAVFSGCAAEKTSVKVVVVRDEGADDVFEEKIYENTVEFSGKNPSIANILDELNKNGDLTVKYTTEEDGTSSLASINQYVNGNDNTTVPITIRQWNAYINDQEVTGLWSETSCKTGDTLLICYDVWESTLK